MSSIRRPINTRSARGRDPVRGFREQGYEKTDLRHREWNDMPPPREPVQTAKAEGRRHMNGATGATLFHDNVIPAGEHCGKIMRQVPATDLLRYGSHRAFRAWPEWASVIDYVERHQVEIEARAANEGPAVRPCEKKGYTKREADTAINCRTHGHQRNRPQHLRAYECERCGQWHLTHQHFRHDT